MRIRCLDINDYEAMIDLWQRSGLTALRPKGRDSREAFARQLESSPVLQTVLGLEVDNQLVGVVVVTHDGRKGWINRLTVDPVHRRCGYAKQLITAAENTLRAQDIHVIATLIERENAVSLALFQQMGYQLAQRICYLSKRDSVDA